MHVIIDYIILFQYYSNLKIIKRTIIKSTKVLHKLVLNTFFLLLLFFFRLLLSPVRAHLLFFISRWILKKTVEKCAV